MKRKFDYMKRKDKAFNPFLTTNIRSTVKHYREIHIINQLHTSSGEIIFTLMKII